jgi:predicted porin
LIRVYWTGLRYSLSQKLDLTAAYYGYGQSSFAGGALVGCKGAVNSACSGSLDAYSIDADYRFNPHFDAYAGAMYSGVHDGVANSYLHVTNINPTIGVRYKF